MAESDISTMTENWKAPLDARGLNISIEDLERGIEAAPAEIQDTADYNFFYGLLCGRQLERGLI